MDGWLAAGRRRRGREDLAGQRAQLKGFGRSVFDYASRITIFVSEKPSTPRRHH
jgi:hypothetical protein